MSTETKPPAGERETPEQVAAWCDEAARLIVEAINESVTFVIDYTSDDWRDKIAAIIAIHADSLTAERDELKRENARLQAEVESRWIPVSERLPEDGSSTVVFVPGWEDAYLLTRVAWIDYDTQPASWIANGEVLDGVTHWRPLPAPPSTSKEQKK